MRRFEVHLVSLDPTGGSEITKTRPCLVISPDEMNAHIRTVIVAPLDAHGKHYPTRVPCAFRGKEWLVVLDHIRTVDSSRLEGKLGQLGEATGMAVLRTLQEMFSP